MNKILVVGGGGREHAMVWKLSQSRHVDKIYAAPGNPGMKDLATCIDIPVGDFTGLASFAKDEGIGLVVVGPDRPLGEGIVDFMVGEGLRVFGPTKDAAQIESSKVFANNLMKKYNIPKGGYRTFTDYGTAWEYLQTVKPPYVIKPDGLTEGKGVVIAETLEEADIALKENFIDARFGESSTKVIVEEFLIGPEFSYMAFLDGENVYPMPIAKDHKRAFEGDKGPNTGGMGRIQGYRR